MAMTIRQVRAALRTIERCSPSCPGWGIFESDSRGIEIERCDACCHKAGGGPRGRDLRDDDLAVLPEAKKALKRALED